MRKKNTIPSFNATNLNNVLWETMHNLTNGAVDVKTANSIAGQSREMMRVKKTQIDTARLMGKVTKKELKQITF